MTILQNRRTAFSLTNTDVMSSAAPSSEAGIEKSDGQEGFFIYTSKAFDLWFKDANGAWSLYNSYGLADIADGVAFSWNTNTAAFIRTQEASHRISVFVIQTKTVGSFGNQEQTSVSSAGLDRLKEHSNYKRVRMQNSGHTGEAYAIAIFDANGEASYVSAPVSGQREGKALGWDENGALGWITLASAASFTTFGDTTETDGVYSLDGSGDYVTYDGDHRFTDQFSISVWFKSDGATSAFDTIISNHDGGNIANGNTFMLYPTGKLRIKTADSGTGTTGDALNLGSGLGDGGWHQVVVTWEANTTNGRKVYIDGSLVHQNNTGTAVYRTTAQSLMYLGGMWIYTTNSFSGNGFDGDITGFSLVNSILTSSEVSDSYVASHPDADGIEDYSVMQNGATLVDGELVLDGIDQYATLADADVYDRLAGEDVTMHMWVYANSFSANNRMTLMRKGVVGPSDWDGYMIELRDTSHSNIATGDMGIKIFSTDYNGGVEPNNTIFRPSGGISLNQWHHIAVTMKDSNDQIEVYFDGQSLGTWTAAQGLSHGNQYDLKLGGDGVSGRSLDGKMKKVTIEKSILTAEQIDTLYLADAPPAVSVTSPSQYWDGSSTSTQLGSNTLSAVTIDNTDGKYEDGFFNFGTSGTKTPARVGTQVSLSTGIYTFSLWFKNKRAGSDFGSVIRQSGTGASSANYAIGTHQTTNELGLHKGGATNTSPGFGFFSSGYDMSSFEGDSSWNHLAVVADGTNSTFYVNGQQAGNVVANVVTSHFKELGAYDGNDTQVFAEGLDEVAYWDSALTSDQVEAIYNSSTKLSDLV